MRAIDQRLTPCSDERRFLVDSDPFWPVIDLHLLREQLRLGAEISAARLEVCARVAAAKVARQFCAGRRAMRGQGYRTLLDLAARGECSELARSYWRALKEATRFELDTGLTEVECVDAAGEDCQR